MNSDERAVWLEKDDVIDAAQEVATSEGQVRQYKKFLCKYMYLFIPAGFLPLTCFLPFLTFTCRWMVLSSLLKFLMTRKY